MSLAPASAARQCVMAMSNPMVHASATRGAKRLKTMDDEKKSLYLCMYAAYANCVDCVRYWINQGVDIEQPSESGSYTVLSWAQHGNATAVIPIVEAELTRKRTRCQAFGSQQESEAMDTEDVGGVWQGATELDMAQLETYLSNASGCELWEAAVSGKVDKLCYQLHIARSPVPWMKATHEVPDRLFYWELLHYVWLAELVAEQKTAPTQNIAAAGIELQMQERHAVECILRYLAALPDADAEKQLWNSLAVGELRLEIEEDIAKERLEWWTAGFRSIICATENNCEKFNSYFELLEWWIYDAFIHADDFGLIVPAVCRRWRLAEFMYALKKWHNKDTAHSLTLVEQREKWLVARAYSGRHCWYVAEKKLWRLCFASMRLFERIEMFNWCPCRFWV